MDIDTIPPGVDFTDYLKRAVGGCDVLLAFICEEWVELTDETGRRRLDDPDDWVVAEIAAALARDVPVIPVSVDGATLPAERLPPQLLPLLKRQATRLRFDSFSGDLAHLVAGIDHVGRGASEGEPTAAATPAPAGPFADRWQQEPERHERTLVGLAVPPAADVYSAGATIGHLLNAGPVDGRLAEVLATATSPDPASRQPDAHALLSDLAEAAQRHLRTCRW